MDYAHKCDEPGPHIKISSAYEKQVWCNRVSGHPGAHRFTDARTFAIVAEWATITPIERDPKKRRKVKP